MSGPRRPSILRYPLAALACAAVVGVWAAIGVGVGWLVFVRLEDFIERQVWVLRVPLQCLAGLSILVVFTVGWGMTKLVWYEITQPIAAPTSAGQKHGAHSKWRPGYNPGDEPPRGEGAGWHGQCPKCGFTFQWDGTHCGHCKYTKPA